MEALTQQWASRLRSDYTIAQCLPFFNLALVSSSATRASYITDCIDACEPESSRIEELPE